MAGRRAVPIGLRAFSAVRSPGVWKPVDQSTGFLRRTRRWFGNYPSATSGVNDVVTVFTPDSSGQVAMEQYYGSDLQPVGTTALCTLALPGADQYQIRHTYQYGVRSSSQFHTSSGTPFGPRYVDQTVDRNTGLPSISRDVAGIATSYEYDVMGQQTWVKPETEQGAWTKYDHLIATGPGWNGRREHTTFYTNGGSTVFLAKIGVFDSFGHPWAEQRLMPGQVWATRHSARCVRLDKDMEGVCLRRQQRHE